MIDFEARKVVEALRSGVSSRAVGQYFSSARPDIMSQISKKINNVCENKVSDGMIITGKYGEGKTHLLNTVFNMAQCANMAVSLVSLSKETPFDKPHLVYQKLAQNTYLPNRLQPGFLNALSDLTPNHPISAELQAHAAKRLVTDKLFYLLRAYMSTDDPEEKYWLLADLEGDFISGAVLKKIYRRIFSEKVSYNVNFAKTKHIGDYFSMLGHLFLQLGCDGWVILFDEAELIGRLGKKARLNAYKNMAPFLFPGDYPGSQAAFSIFAMTSSYVEDVIDGKHEFENLSEAALDPKDAEAAEKVLRAIASAKQLQPLTKAEIAGVMEKLLDFYKRAYDWRPDLNMSEIAKKTDNRGYLLRTRIRAAVECLDQLYQYGRLGDIKISELGQVSYEEDIPELPFEEESNNG